MKKFIKLILWVGPFALFAQACWPVENCSSLEVDEIRSGAFETSSWGSSHEATTDIHDNRIRKELVIDRTAGSVELTYEDADGHVTVERWSILNPRVE